MINNKLLIKFLFLLFSRKNHIFFLYLFYFIQELAKKDNEIIALKSEVMALKTINGNLHSQCEKSINKFHTIKQSTDATITQLKDACTKLQAEKYKLTMGYMDDAVKEIIDDYKQQIQSLNEEIRVMQQTPIEWAHYKKIAEEASSENLQLRNENAKLRSRVNKKLKSAAKSIKAAPKQPPQLQSKDDIDAWL